MTSFRLTLAALALTIGLAGCTTGSAPATQAGVEATPASTAVPASPMPTSVPRALREDTQAILEGLGGYPCPDSDFTCVDLEVPVNHFDPANLETIEVVFGVLPASGERKGMFITAVGGPGGD